MQDDTEMRPQYPLETKLNMLVTFHILDTGCEKESARNMGWNRCG